ncbi:MAG TPA: hypothetical protein VM555_11990 [Tahibacter sp.]|nr:hypothetical protein [Tahibacter sp.]
MAAVALVFPTFAHAELVADARFGNAGIVDIATPPGEYVAAPRVAVLSDRRIAVAALTGGAPPASRTLHLARLLQDGRPDPTFGGGAPTAFVVSADAVDHAALNALHVSDDGGQIAVVTLATIDPNAPLAASTRTLLVVAGADGDLDPAFNGGAPLVVTDATHARYRIVALDSGFAVAGFAQDSCCETPGRATLWRFRADGSPDPQFGDAGVVEIVSDDASVRDAIAAAGGGLRVLYTASVGGTASSRWQRRRADGSVDAVSGDGGIEPIAGSGISRVEALGEGRYLGMAGASCAAHLFDAQGRALEGFDAVCVAPRITHNGKAQRYGEGILLSGAYLSGFIPTPAEGFRVWALARDGAPDADFAPGTSGWRPPEAPLAAYDVASDIGGGVVLVRPGDAGLRVLRFVDDRRGTVSGQPVPALGGPALMLIGIGFVALVSRRFVLHARDARSSR